MPRQTPNIPDSIAPRHAPDPCSAALVLSPTVFGVYAVIVAPLVATPVRSEALFGFGRTG
jgi:hypothetical protein